MVSRERMVAQKVDEVVIVSGAEDWEGLYIDGKLVSEGHSIRVHDVLDALGVTLTRINLDDKQESQLERKGSMPKTLKGVQKTKW